MKIIKPFLLIFISCIGIIPLTVFSGAGDITVTGKVTAGSFAGDGSGLTNISPDIIYKSTVVVSPVGTASQNGEVLRSTLAGITSASATNPILLKIEPGIYDIGSTSGITMKEYVDIEGSGEITTKITGSFSNTTPSLPTSGTINGVSNAELRFLTVENICTDGCYAIVNHVNTSPSILHVTASASGDGSVVGVFNGGVNTSPIISHSTITATTSSNTSYSTGIRNYLGTATIIHTTAFAENGIASYGIDNRGSSPTISHTTAIAKAGTDSYGIYNHESIPTLIAVNAIANSGTNNYGMYNESTSSDSKTINIDRSVFEGGTKSIFNVSEYTLNLSFSKVIGGIATAGTTKCIGVASYNGTSVSSVRCRLAPSPP